MTGTSISPGRAILGGSFNPPHLAHIRLAIEVHEKLGLEVDFVPSAVPPHKSAEAMLDFTLRCDLLEMSLDGLPEFTVNRLEGHRPGPSYTYDTIRAYLEQRPGQRPYFIAGGGDFMSMTNWHCFDELMGLCHFIVVPRHGISLLAIQKYIKDNLAKMFHPAPPALPAVSFAWRHRSAGTTVSFLPVTRLDISSSMVREAWRTGHSLKALLPEKVERALLDNKTRIGAIWGERKLFCPDHNLSTGDPDVLARRH